MKPRGIIFETLHDPDKGEDVDVARLIIVAEEEHIFFGGFGGMYSGNDIAEVPVTLEDGLNYHRAKLEKDKMAIVGKYALSNPNNSQINFPHGARIGSVYVGSVIEVKRIPTNKNT